MKFKNIFSRKADNQNEPIDAPSQPIDAPSQPIDAPSQPIDAPSQPVISTPIDALNEISKELLPSPFEWIQIPEGEVTLEPAEGTYITSRQAFSVPTFVIAKYPITNAQFAKFKEAGGYNEKRWWTEKGWEIKEQEHWSSQLAGAYKPDKPAVGICWYVAVAFCQWMNEVVNAQSTVPVQITLPTEQQWQRAAQGNDGRAFPWGNVFDKNKCNTKEGGLEEYGKPVTDYPNGASPYGVMNMSGNCGEWCLTTVETGDTHLDAVGERVIKGGAHTLGQNIARTTYRFWLSPDQAYLYNGIRIVATIQG